MIPGIIFLYLLDHLSPFVIIANDKQYLESIVSYFIILISFNKTSNLQWWTYSDYLSK